MPDLSRPKPVGPWLAAAGLAAVAVGPLLYLGLQSIAWGWNWPAILPPSYGFRAWRYVVSTEAGLGTSLLNSFSIALVVALLSVLVSLPVSRAIAHQEFRFKKLVILLLYLPVLTPPLASAMGLHLIFLRLNLTDTLIGVVLVHLIPAMPYATLMLAGSYARFNTDFELQARTLGASPAMVLRHVTLPILAPGVAIAAVFAFIISWTQYLLTLLIGGGQVVTLPLSLVAFQRSGDDAITAAISVIFLAPAYLVFLYISRFLRDS